MKKYEPVEIKVILFNLWEDVIKTSSPDGDNTLPWIDMDLDNGF